MIEFYHALPAWFATVITMVLTTVCGLLVYGISYKFISDYQNVELKDPISSLFRLVGILVSLMLSLSFSEVVPSGKPLSMQLIERPWLFPT